MNLHSASEAGNEGAVKILLRSGEDVNALDNFGQTPLLEAAAYGHTPVVKLLLEKDGINPDTKDNNGQTPLSRAAKNGHTAVVKLLFEKDGVDPNTKDNGGWTPLSEAAAYGHTPVVKLLLEKDGIDPDTKDNSGQTPLSGAAAYGHTPVVKLLLEKDGIDPDTKDNSGRTPLSRAAEKGHTGVVKLLLEKDGVDPNTKDNSGRTPLSWAVENGYTAVVKLLLEKDGIDPNTKDNGSQTPLCLAAAIGREAVVKLLLEKDGVDPDTKDNDGRTPLSRAAKKGHTVVVKLLLENDGIDPDTKDNNGRTPLSWAAAIGREAVVKLLLEKDGIDPDTKDNDGRTPLWLAVANRHQAVIRLLANDGANRNSKDYPGRTPLSWAAENGHTVVVNLLLKDNIDPNSKDNDGRTPLSRAAENRHEAVVRLLAPGDKVTLHILVQEGKHTPVKLLLNAKYDVNVRDALGRTPLHTAVSFGYLDIARELISSRANINSEDTDGMTPLRLAIQRKDQDLIQLLLKHSVSIKGIMVDEWLDAYEKKASNITVELSEVPGRGKCVRFFEGIPDKMSAEPGTVKHLFLFAEYSAWLRCLISNPRDAVQLDRSQIFHQEQIHSTCVSVSVAGCYPAGQDPGNEKRFDISDWGECGIAWTMTPPTKPKDGLCWKSIDHFSMLPYGWIPDNGADFFTQFIFNLKGRWLRLCSLAEEHLSKRRLDQLREKGDSPELIHYLAEDAQEWAKLRSILRGQVRTARNFAVEHCRRYNEDKSLRAMQEVINSFSDEVNDQINQLDQTVKDLLQFEFAWVSINEAHRSTSIATSMKRLSWITFIFLPAMFASSLFGMNVDILKTNPDWRWYILFGGGSLTLTIVGWLLFKYGRIEGLIERHIGTRLERWSSYMRGSKGSQQMLPTSEQVKH